ncbi:carbamoyl-phosphate synthase L chain, ATP binding domain-containing protein [Terfezia claveryi]|nr:carbamoyl-phosphate synthase L chain, ATP binding domain-containing protein [Terfezia claveryi]
MIPQYYARTLRRPPPSIFTLFLRSRYSSTSTSTPQPNFKPLTNILIANRGEIALRVSRTASAHGIRTTTVYTEPDRLAPHALCTPHSVNIGPPSAYLDVEKIIKAAKDSSCDSVHPGYGFLSENAKFAERCEQEGLMFIGPPPSAIEKMGNKSESKNIMISAGVPCIPGYHGPNQDPQYLLSEATKVGFPVLIKAVKGGGGKGMRISDSPLNFLEQLASAKSEAVSSFGDSNVLIERYITTPRHIEVQVFADAHGNCVALGERDCSVQRRHQKILEESPAPNLDPKIRRDILEKARAAALAVGYRGAGTVEFIFDNDTGEFFFMEMNTRLQVEHPVTEMVTETDLVEWQLLVARGEPLPWTQEQVEEKMNGWGFEARIYAENPDMNFIPDSGPLIHLKTPTPTDTVRIDAGFGQGDVISSHYDPMIAKLIVKGPTREAALLKLRKALEEYEVVGMSTNIEFLKKLAVHPAFVKGDVETGFIQKYREDLFQKVETPSEVFAQAALSVVVKQNIPQAYNDPFSVAGGGVGYTGGLQARTVLFTEKNGCGEDITTRDVEVVVTQTSPQSYDVVVGGKTTFNNITTSLSSQTKITSFYPHTRLDTTVVRDEDTLTVFQHGKKFTLTIPRPAWLDKALGIKKLTEGSVLAPMPCKVLRVMVEEGEKVGKGDALVVIESMKMETVIRSPREGVVGKVVHGVGEMVKMGTTLVEFAAEGEVEGENKALPS